MRRRDATHDRVDGGALRRRRLRVICSSTIFEDKLFYGPYQIQARTYQPESRNLAATFAVESDGLEGTARQFCSLIPIQDSLLYVEPLFIRRLENGQLPELQRGSRRTATAS